MPSPRLRRQARPRIRSWLDYLLAREGDDALARLAVAARQSVTLEAATVQAFALPLDVLVAEAALWRQASERAGPPPSTAARQQATLLHMLEAQPFVALVVGQEGTLLRLHGTEAMTLPIPTRCLGMGTRLSFEGDSGGEREIEALRVEVLHPPARMAGCGENGEADTQDDP